MKLNAIIFAATLLFSNATFADIPESGWWWNPERSGSGFNIEVQRDTVFVATFVYDEGGDPVWYSGAGRIANSTVRLTLMESAGGPCIDCPYVEPNSSAVREITIRFPDKHHGEVYWGGRKTEKIERFNFGFGAGWEFFLGEWIVISKQLSGSGRYGGDRITFTRASEYGIEGTRTGVSYKKATIGRISPDISNDYNFYMRIDSPGGLSSYYAFNRNGYNKIEGVVALISTDDDADSIEYSIDNFSEAFEAYRAN